MAEICSPMARSGARQPNSGVTLTWVTMKGVTVGSGMGDGVGLAVGGGTRVGVGVGARLIRTREQASTSRMSKITETLRGWFKL